MAKKAYIGVNTEAYGCPYCGGDNVVSVSRQYHCNDCGEDILESDVVYETKSVARKIKKGYVGVDGKARQIKKAYIGIGGVARPCWNGGGKPTAYGAITALSVARFAPTGATVDGKYALFAGGQLSGGNYSDRVDVYDESLTKTTATVLTAARQDMFSGTIGGRAIFAGGNSGHLF